MYPSVYSPITAGDSRLTFRISIIVTLVIVIVALRSVANSFQLRFLSGIYYFVCFPLSPFFFVHPFFFSSLSSLSLPPFSLFSLPSPFFRQPLTHTHSVPVIF